MSGNLIKSQKILGLLSIMYKGIRIWSKNDKTISCYILPPEKRLNILTKEWKEMRFWQDIHPSDFRFDIQISRMIHFLKIRSIDTARVLNYCIKYKWKILNNTYYYFLPYIYFRLKTLWDHFRMLILMKKIKRSFLLNYFIFERTAKKC